MLMYSASAATAGPPQLTITKQACQGVVNPGDAICFNIVVENSGDTDSSQVHVTDDLPGAVLWHITGNTLGCTLNTDLDPTHHQSLDCTVESIAHRHLNSTQSAFVNGVAAVQIAGIAGGCNSTYTNFGARLDDPLDGYNNVASGTATISVTGSACPTPTPSPTPTTPTPTPSTPTPTATPSPTDTPAPPTPIIIVIHDTPTPNPAPAITPRPPATGTGVLVDQRHQAANSNWTLILGLITTGLGLAFIAVGMYVAQRRPHATERLTRRE